MSHIDLIVTTARKYIDEEEFTPNLGFKDSSFQQKMIAVGFKRYASWCGFFVKLVMKEVYSDSPVVQAYLKRYLSASTHDTWANCKASKEVITGQVPKLGAVVVWQDGSAGVGHEGIVVSVLADNKHFTSVEGNTNGNKGREGYRVWENAHITGLPHKEKGLNILGFCYMPE